MLKQVQQDGLTEGFFISSLFVMRMKDSGDFIARKELLIIVTTLQM
jgi:hypothetical protein